MNISAKEFQNKLFSNEYLPEGLVVNGYLCLYGCTSLTHLPKGLVVNGWLGLYGCTSLTHLPEGLVVHGKINLNRCTSLTHLPEGLVVNGYLCLYRCTSLTHLPFGLVVKSIIYCDKELIDKIPKEELPLYINFPFKKEIHEYLCRKIQEETPQ